MRVRQPDAASLVKQAEVLYARGDNREALAKLRVAVELDTADRGARELLRRVQDEIKSQAAEEAIRAMVAEADHLLESGNETEALERLRAAQQYDSRHRDVLARIDRIQDARGRRARVSMLVTQAEDRLREADLTGVRQLLTEILTLDPSNARASTLFEEMRKAEAEAEMPVKLQQASRPGPRASGARKASWSSFACWQGARR